MKSFNRMLVGMVFLFGVIIVGANIYFSAVFRYEGGRTYQVEISRLQREIRLGRKDRIDLDNYPSIHKITVLEEQGEAVEFFEGTGSDYAIRYINGLYYRFDYQMDFTKEHKIFRWGMNILLGILAAILGGVLFYVRLNLIQPFDRLTEVPYELSKGNLTIGLKENKNRFFGRFIWGLNLLRENMEEQKKKELSLQKEKKTLVLSLSHEIKTPLSAIKLYAKALSRNLYDSEEKGREIAGNIEARANEIEGFTAELIKASSEDFLNIEVKEGEFYLSELILGIQSYYEDKLSVLRMELRMGQWENCLLKGDIDRAAEALQNIIENAIKYGDGRYLAIHISGEEDCRLITIANSGCTLPPNELPHIFESFWRGSNAGSNSGSGLGLYICRRIMRKMCGDIFAQCRESEMQVTVVIRIQV